MSYTKNITLIACLLAVSACSGNVKRTLGLGKEAPDEFKVVANQPLSVPPDFRLVEPRPGAKRPQVQALDKQAESVLFKSDYAMPTTSTQASVASLGEQHLLARAGGDANPNIRDILAEQERTEVLEEEKGFLSKMWSDESQEDDPILNATEEKKRIAEAKKSGEVVTGEEAAIHEQKDRGVLGELLDF